MTSRPLVTVVIPTYRRADRVGRAIRSVLRQTCKDVEAVVVDDCSPDDTRLVVQSLAHPAVRYLRHETNTGGSAARNTGMEAALGEYIALLDDDDQWVEWKLERQMKAIQGYDGVVCGAMTPDGQRIGPRRGHEVSATQLRRGNRYCPSGLLVRASALRNLEFDVGLPGGVGDDWDMYIRLVQKHRVLYIPEALVIYDDSHNSPRITTDQAYLSIDALEERTRVVNKHREFLGSFWYRYHVASTLLVYLGRRDGKLKSIFYALRRCGGSAVLAVLCGRLLQRLDRMVDRRVLRRHEVSLM